MIEEADRNALIVIKEMRDATKVADEHNAPGTVDLLSRFVQIHESTSGGFETSCASETVYADK